jgi:hypothetical protein
MAEKLTYREIFNPSIAIPVVFFLSLAIWGAWRCASILAEE